MPTKKFSPHSVAQLTSEEIEFSDGDATLDQTLNLTTVVPTLAVAHSSGRLVTEGSRTLVFRDFRIPTDLTVQGIEVILAVDRLARIQDRIVQLYYQGQLVGENRANLQAENIQSYGGADDLWGTKNVDFTSESFGVAIDLGPHTQYPSNNLVYFRSLELVVHYS